MLRTFAEQAKRDTQALSSGGLAEAVIYDPDGTPQTLRAFVNREPVEFAFNDDGDGESKTYRLRVPVVVLNPPTGGIFEIDGLRWRVQPHNPAGPDGWVKFDVKRYDPVNKAVQNHRRVRP